MSTKSIVITDIVRRGADVKEDRLQFRSGVNVLVGDPNTGKTKWMETIDFLLGDSITAEQRETDDIYMKFDSANLTAHIGGDKFEIERKWKEKGALTKVFVNGEALNLEDYHSLLLKQLGISPFHYPQGSPYGPRSWPELGWRSLMRHVYRRQRMWTDLADKQPPSEQHASLLQFLGVADKAFSSDFESLADKQKQLIALEAQRENFVAMLQEISRELMDAEELSVALTPQSILEAEERLAKEEEKLRSRRDALLVDLQKKMAADSTPTADGVEELTQRLVRLQGEREATLTALRKVVERKRELDDYRQILGQELERLERAAEAGNLFADLKVTHCPACDREVTRGDSGTGHCYVCKQPLSEATASGIERIQFELEQLRGEAGEMDDLLGGLASEVQGQQKHLEVLGEDIGLTQQLLRPVRIAAAAILPPELAIADMSIGRLQEKRNQLQRVNASLARRQTLAQQIKKIQTEIDTLSGAVTETAGGVDYRGLGDRLSDGMNTYLNKLNLARKSTWVVGDVAFQLEERSFKIRVGKADWQTKLGGTLTLYFLLAYQYALLDLMRFPESHFPGLLLIDFPAELEGTSVADKENFVIEPFIELLSHKEMGYCQVIAAGSSFVGLEGAERVELSHVWKA
jgi:hypothetical protein